MNLPSEGKFVYKYSNTFKSFPSAWKTSPHPAGRPHGERAGESMRLPVVRAVTVDLMTKTTPQETGKYANQVRGHDRGIDLSWTWKHRIRLSPRAQTAPKK